MEDGSDDVGIGLKQVLGALRITFGSQAHFVASLSFELFLRRLRLPGAETGWGQGAARERTHSHGSRSP